ncbi:MAG: Ig-like domain-containing protein, partial [Gemmatimonadaceae bacterium]
TDQFGNAVAGSVINWTVAGGGTLSGSSSTSDVNGLAQIALTTDPTPAVYTVTATGAAGTPVSFTVTGT